MLLDSVHFARRLLSRVLVRRRGVVAVATLFTLLDTSGLQSQVTVGTPGGHNCFLFDCWDSGDRFQTLYAASAFPGPMTITGLTFFLAPGIGPVPSHLAPGIFNIMVAISNKPIGGLSTNLDDNISFDEQLFTSATLPLIAVNATSFTIFGNPFFYDPALGNLLIDVTSLTSYGGPDILSTDVAHTDVETAACSGPAFGSECGAGPGFAALVTRFDDTIISTPEPGTVWLVGTGLIALIFWRQCRARLLQTSNAPR